jgi:signal transduction histidine kinase
MPDKLNNMKDIQGFIHQLDFFDSIEDHLLDDLVLKLKPALYRDQEIIWNEGDSGDWGFVIVSGEIEVYKKAENGAMIAVDLLKPNQWGGISNFLVLSKRHYRFVCRGDVNVLTINKEDLSELMKTDSSLSIALLKVMSQRFADNTSRLADTIQYLTEILGFASHELQSPISSMVTDAQLLTKEYLGPLNEKQKEKLKRSINKGKYLLNLIQKYLNLSRLEDVSLKLRITPNVNLIEDVVEPMIDLFESERLNKNIKFDYFCVDEILIVECDIVLIRIAFSNLLKNAIHYGNEGGRIRVSIQVENETACVKVWNEGSGFSKKESNKLFKRFSRLDNPALRLKPGTGIGLYSTWKIMQLHSGKVEADSEEGKWAEFKLTFPIKQTELPEE